MRTILKISLFILALIFFFSNLAWAFFGPVNKSRENIIFIIPQEQANFNLTNSLFEQKLIKNKRGFEFLFKNFSKNKIIKPGGYKLNQSINSWQVMKKLEMPISMLDVYSVF